MVQSKDKKVKYRNIPKQIKAAFCGRGFYLHSKIISKPMNIHKQIIQRKTIKGIPFRLVRGGKCNG